LWQAAHELLKWWRVLHNAAAAHNKDEDTGKVLAEQQPALELAAALTRGLTADSSLQRLNEIITLTALSARCVTCANYGKVYRA
jgi:hypothetical protein